MSKPREYNVWVQMKQRCFNPNVKAYPNYGGRGITVCDRWLDFDNFYNDMGECPTGLTLDRTNNDGDYEPSNCRWATRTEQGHNRRVLCSNRSGYTGVHWKTAKRLWVAQIRVDGKKQHLGYFKDIKLAAQAYNTALNGGTQHGQAPKTKV